MLSFSNSLIEDGLLSTLLEVNNVGGTLVGISLSTTNVLVGGVDGRGFMVTGCDNRGTPTLETVEGCVVLQNARART